MADDLSKFGFQEEEDNELEQFDFKTDDPDMSDWDVGLTGALTGPTFGFSDEFAGAVEAAGQAVGVKGLGAPNFSELEFQSPKILEPEALLKAYREARDVERARQEKAYEQSPGIYTTSAIIGGLATPIPGTSVAKTVTSGVKAAKPLSQIAKEGAKTGTKYGAIAGLGVSENDLLSGDSKEIGGAVKDIGSGALIGAGVGGLAIPGATALFRGGKWLTKEALGLVTESDTVKIAKDAFRFAREGSPVVNKMNEVTDEMRDFVLNIKDKVQKMVTKKSEDRGKLLSDNEINSQTTKIIDKLNSVKEKIKKLPERTEDEKNAKLVLLDEIEQKISGIQKFEKQTKEIILPSKKEQILENLKQQKRLKEIEAGDVDDIAQQKLLQKQAKEKAVTGEDINFNEETFIDPATGKQVKVSRELQDTDPEVLERIAAGEFDQLPKTRTFVEDVIPPKPGEIKTYKDPKTGYEIAEIIDENTGKVIRRVLPDEAPRVKKITEAVEKEVQAPQTEMTPDELFSFRQHLSKDIIPDLKTSESRQLGKNLIKEIDESLPEEVRQKTQEMSKLLSSFRAITGKELQNVKKAGEGEIGDVISSINKRFQKTLRDADADAAVREGFEMFSAIDPKLGKSFKKSFEELTKKYDVATAGEASIQNTSDLLRGTVGGVRSALTRTSELGGKIVGGLEKTAEPTKELVKRGFDTLTKYTPDQLQQLASNLATYGSAFSRVVARAATEPDQTRNAILFGLMQNPAFRKEMKSILPGDEEQ